MIRVLVLTLLAICCQIPLWGEASPGAVEEPETAFPFAIAERGPGFEKLLKKATEALGEELPDGFSPEAVIALAAAKAGNASAQICLGLMFSEGEVVPHDYDQAIFWFEHAAGQGNPEACYQLGQLFGYSHECGVASGTPGTHRIAQNDALAGKWLIQAAEQGHREAQFQMALHTQDDPETCVAWFRTAAAQGHVTAAAFLGSRLAKADAPAEELQEGILWLRFASEAGNGLAQMDLAKAYEQGVGVATDPIEAYAWMTLAGWDRARILEERLTPEQRERAVLSIRRKRELIEILGQ